MSEAGPLTPKLLSLAARAAQLLQAQRETVAVCEGAAGGLVCAALLSVPGASNYFLGGGVIYTLAASRGFIAGAVKPPTTCAARASRGRCISRAARS